MLFCPDCVNKSGYALMDLLEGSRYDDIRHLPVIIWLCPTCESEVKMIGLICITCGGTGDVTLHNRIMKDCPECKGMACHPQFIEIENGKVVPSKNMQQPSDTEMDVLWEREKRRMGFS